MRFSELSELFSRLEEKKRRLEKVMILRDFYKRFPNEAPLIFDIISGSYQREIQKKQIGISFRTLFEVISFVSKTDVKSIEKLFNKKGDIGVVAEEFLSKVKQKGLLSSELRLADITEAFERISQKKGSLSNNFKKEVLGRLFMMAQSGLEFRYLARMLIDDLRIGVMEGTLREAVLQVLFPPLLGIHKSCAKCFAINLNISSCYNCSEVFIGDSFLEGRGVSFNSVVEILNSDKVDFITGDNVRELYNEMLFVIEKKYNILNSFREFFSEIEKDKKNILNLELVLGRPIRSMLGFRALSVEEAFSSTGTPSLLDFKYDGLRIQAHIFDSKVILFSRNLEDISRQFPEVVSFFKEIFSGENLILDCECVGYDFSKDSYLPFQILSRRILTKDVNSVSEIKVVIRVFDIMYDEVSLLEMPYSVRREKLDKLFIGREILIF